MYVANNLWLVFAFCVLVAFVLLGQTERSSKVAKHDASVKHDMGPAAAKKLPWHFVASNKSVGFKLNRRRQIIIHVSENASRQDCVDLLRHYGETLPPKSRVIVRKLNYEAVMKPWCIDNHDGADFVFKTLTPSAETAADTLPLPNHAVASDVPIGMMASTRRRVTIHATGNISRAQCINLLNRYGKTLAPRSQVVVARRNFTGAMKPWCVDNLDGTTIWFNDWMFDAADPTHQRPMKF